MGWTMTVFGTDVHTNGADGGHKAINRYDGGLGPNQGFVRQTWVNFYRGINQANAVINRSEGLDIPEDVKTQRIAEVRFLRALFYFNLTRTYGDIHLTLEETEGVETTANKTASSEIYSQAIIPDLEFAISTLPEVQDDLGRVTKPAAEYLLGKVLLTRSYTDFAAGDDASRAELLFTTVIDNYGFELAEDYLELWGLNEIGVPVNIATAEDSPEIIWAVQNSKSQVDEGLDGQGHRAHLYFLMEYDKLPGMTRDTENGRPWKRFRPTEYALSLWDRTMDRRYDETYKHVWLANNTATIPTDDAGNPLYEVGDTTIYIPGPGKAEMWDAAAKQSVPYVVVTSRASVRWRPLVLFRKSISYT